MICLLRALAVIGLVGGWALAQDTLLQSYRLASESLSEALTRLPQDPSLSSEALGRAANALRPLSRDTTSPQLLGALQGVFGRAQTAVDNRSPVDLAAQVAVLRGGMGRLVYESALRAANDGDLEAARARLDAVLSDLGASQSTRDALDPSTSQRLLAAFDAGLAGVMQGHLGNAQQSGDRGSTYVSLASAYGAHFPAQDSPRLAQPLSAAFGAAFSALITDDPAALQNALGTLQQGAQGFADAASASLALPSPDPSNPAPSSPGAPSEAATAPVAAPIAVPITAPTPATGGQTEGQGTLSAAPPLLDAPANTALQLELEPFALNAAVRDQLAAQYRSSGYGSLQATFDALYGDGSRALVALQAARPDQARTSLDAFRGTYERLVAPLIRSRDPALDSGTLALLDGLRTTPDPRAQDVAVLLGQVGAMQQLGAQPVTLSAQRLWSGWLRLGVLLVLGILAFVPLRLLNLAFGGANRNWQLVGAALFLLLLPVIYEAVSAVLAALASVTGVNALAAPSAYSPFQHPLGQLAWALLTAAAIGLAISGLYGICLQFGLLGKKTGKETIISTQDSSLKRGKAAQSADWDEEF